MDIRVEDDEGLIKITGLTNDIWENPLHLSVRLQGADRVIIYDKVVKTSVVNASYLEYIQPNADSAELLAPKIAEILKSAQGKGGKKTQVNDDNANELLSDIIKELKITNQILSEAFEINI